MSVDKQEEKGPSTIPFTAYHRWAVPWQLDGLLKSAGGQGYADKIEVLIGFDPGQDYHYRSVYVLDQKETPGLGNKIVTPQWRGQFIDKSTKHTP